MRKNRQQNVAAHSKHMMNSVSSKNPTLSNLEENLGKGNYFSMTDENTSLLSETTSGQQPAGRQINDEIISQAVTGDGAKTTTECVTVDVHRGVSPSMEKKRGEVKAAVARKRPKQVLTQSGKRQISHRMRKALKSPPTRVKQRKLFAVKKAGKPREHRHHLLHELLT